MKWNVRKRRTEPLPCKPEEFLCIQNKRTAKICLRHSARQASIKARFCGTLSALRSISNGMNQSAGQCLTKSKEIFIFESIKLTITQLRLGKIRIRCSEVRLVFYLLSFVDRILRNLLFLPIWHGIFNLNRVVYMCIYSVLIKSFDSLLYKKMN